jgi:hypothetical protein
MRRWISFSDSSLRSVAAGRAKVSW